MPSRNSIKIYAPESYYHIYNRGVEKRKIFNDDEDYRVFLGLLKRYLSGKKINDKFHRSYQDLSGDMDLLAYCLMPNHFHLFIYQHDQNAIKNLMSRLMTSYSMYFNKKYKRVGTLFQGRYKASTIDQEQYLLHISRYIHLNSLDINRQPEDYQYSSMQYYLGKKADWIKPRRILQLYPNESYKTFVLDYVGYKKILNDIKAELAD